MADEIKVAIVGLDTSHTIEFTRRIQGTGAPEDQMVSGMRVVSCMRFPSPFQSEPDQDKRQAQMEEWSVKVTRDLKEAVADCDAIMLEINDPALHLEYFKKVAELGKPIFLDKPLAATLSEGREIVNLARAKNVQVWSSSSLRFADEFVDACEAVPSPRLCNVFGPLGKAPAGESVVWYGVHSFEMLVRAMGRGASTVFAKQDPAGVVAIVEYPDGRRGVVECNENSWQYGGRIQGDKVTRVFSVSTGRIYYNQLLKIRDFFAGAPAPVELNDALEVQALMEATVKSIQSQKTEEVLAE